MTVVSTSNFIQDVTILVKDIISGGVIDPIDSTRPTNERFLMTSYPRRAVTYPIITVQMNGLETVERLGIASESQWMRIPFEIRIWAKDMRQRDSLTQQAYIAMMDNQLNSNSVASGVFGFQLLSTVPVTEDVGKDQTIQSNVMQAEYNFLALQT